MELKFWKTASAEEDTEKYANELFEGAVRRVKFLDAAIQQHCDNWRFERLAAIDRSVLRLAIHEMQSTKTPHKVIISEAVDLAKKFSGDDSGSFVNGVLHAASQAHKKSKAKPA
jgi:N utilization substance protein B